MKRYNCLVFLFSFLLLSHKISSQDWTPSQTISEPSGSTSDLDFGHSLSANGSLSAVGVPVQNAVHVYEQISGTWTFRVTLAPSDLSVGDNFGFDVSVEGDVIVVGSPFAGTNSEGQVYIWEKPAGGWELAGNEDVVITNSAVSPASGRFGQSVDLKGDELLIGAPYQAVNSISGHGQAYLFSKANGASWKTSTQTASFLHPVSSSDHFGFSVAIETDQIAVGAPKTGGNAGNAFVFEKSGSSWTSRTTADAVLRKPNRSSGDEFGSTVVASGEYFVFSAGGTSGNYIDVYVFKTPAAGWSVEYTNNGTLEPNYVIVKDAASTGLTFGSSLSVEGNLLAVGDKSHGITNTTRYGKVWVYDLGETSASLLEEIEAPSLIHLAEFGSSVALSGSQIVVGAPNQTTTGQVFTYSGSYQVSTSDVICFSSTYLFDGQNLTSPGTYNATFTASNGLDSLVTLTLTQNPQLNFAFSFDPIGCNGGTGGITFDSPIGGDGGPYEYSVDGGSTFQTSPVFTNLSTGAKTLVLRDALGCTRSQGTFLSEPAALTIVSTQVTAALCNAADGPNLGSVDVQVSGGSAAYYYSTDGVNYTYNGAGINTTVTIGSLSPDSYTIYIKDGNDCEVTTSETVTEPAAITFLTNRTNPSCNGGADGSIVVTAGTVSGGDGGPYTYSLNSGGTQTSNTFTGLSAGQYFVNVFDGNLCFGSFSYTLSEPAAISASTTITNSTSCSAPDGSISLTVSGGTGSYFYTLNGGAASNPMTGLAAGSYLVGITDSNGCSISLSETVTEPAAPQVATNFLDPTCFGADDGTFSAVGFDGVAPYEYSFNGGSFSSSQSISGIGPGSHSVVVRDANGCTSTKSVFLIEPDVLAIDNIVGSDLGCYQGGDGEITLDVSGGTFLYSYSLDGVNFTTFNTTSTTISNLDAGAYTVTIRDANNCTTSSNVTLVEPSAFGFTTSISNVSCFGESDGAVSSITPSGGNGAPYTYSIDGVNYQTTPSFSGLSAGQFTVYVQDANGCEISTTETISEPTEIVATVSKTETSTCGATDGQLVITTSGGVAPYSYAINGGSSQSSGTFSGLIAGVYSIDVTDATGCTFTVNDVISDPITATVTTTVTDALCSSVADGGIIVNVTGGTAPIEYSIDGGAFQTSNEFNNLGGGTYSVEVREANGCTQSVTVSVDEPDPSLPAVGTSTYATTYGTSFSNWAFAFDPSDNVSTHFLIDNIQGNGLHLSGGPISGSNGLVPSSNLSALEFIPESVGTFTFDVQPILGTSNFACASGSPLTVTITVNPATLAVVADNQSKVYGEANPALTFAYSGFVNGEDVGVVTTAPTATTSATSSSVVGDYDITLSGGVATNYALDYTVGTLTISKANLTVTANDKQIAFGQVAQLDGTITGIVNGDNINVDYSTVANSSSDVGTYAINAALVDPNGRVPNYNVTNNPGTLTIVKADQEITFSSIDDVDLLTSTTTTLSATSDVGLPVTFTVTQGQSIASISGNVVTVSNTGNVTIEASQAGNTNYNSASATQSFNVVDSRKTDQTITFAAIADKTYGDASFTLGATASSSLPVQYTLTGPATLSGSDLTITGIGLVTITADQSGDNTFNPAPSVSQSFTVNQAQLSVVVNDQSMIYGDQVPTLDGSLSGVVNGDNIVVTYSTPADGTETGDFAIEGLISDPDGKLGNYAVSNTAGTLTVAKAELTVVANNYEIAFGEAIPPLEGVIAGIKNSDNISATYATIATSSSDVGNYAIEVTLVDQDARLDNYTITETDGTLVIVKADQSITFDPINSIDISTTNTVSLVASASSGLAVVFTLLEGEGSIAGSTLTVNSSGNFTVTANQEGNGNYNPATDVQQSFQVTDSRKLDQTITFEALGARTYGETFTLSATSSSGLSVSYSSTGPASISSNTVTITGVGEVTVTASQTGDGDYNPAQDVSQTFMAEKAELTATADNKTISEGDAIPELTVSYSGFVNGEDASVLDAEPDLTTSATATSEAGEYTIVLTGGSDENYEFALVNGTLTIEEVLGFDDDSSVEIYPNPFTDQLTVEGAEIAIIEIRDLSGKVLYKTKERKIDASEWNAGVYLIVLKNGEAKIIGQMRVKKND